MIVSFLLNGESKEVNAPGEKRLIDILREDFQILSVKAGCYHGYCGYCTVLLDDQPVSACMTPLFTIKNAKVQTMEGIQRKKTFLDIQKSFNETGYEPCSYCYSSKVLSIYAFIKSGIPADEKEILRAISGIHCLCTSHSLLIKSVKKSLNKRTQRIHGNR